MADNRRFIFKLNPVAQERLKIRKKAIENERMMIAFRMINNDEPDERIALYTKLDISLIQKGRQMIKEYTIKDPELKSRAFQHYGLSFRPRKYPWYLRGIMYIRYTIWRKRHHS